MTAVDTARLEQVLGPGLQTMGRRELYRREHTLETAADFMRSLGRSMDDRHAYAAGEALAVLAERQAPYPSSPAHYEGQFLRDCQPQ